MNKRTMKQMTALMKPLWNRINDRLNRKQSQRVILTYHGVSVGRQFNCIPRDLFREQIAWLKEHYTIVSLSNLIDSLNVPDVNQKDVVSITFDDGYVNFAELALPSLLEIGCHGTVFIPSGKAGHYNDWDERRSDFVRMPLMSYDQLRNLPEDNVEIGSHGVTHSPINRLSYNEAVKEIVQSRYDLEQNLGRAVRLLSFPYGGYPVMKGSDEGQTRQKVFGNYKGACTIRWGRYNSLREVYALKRVGIWEHDTFEDFTDKLSGYYDWIAVKENVARFITR